MRHSMIVARHWWWRRMGWVRGGESRRGEGGLGAPHWSESPSQFLWFWDTSRSVQVDTTDTQTLPLLTPNRWLHPPRQREISALRVFFSISSMHAFTSVHACTVIINVTTTEHCNLTSIDLSLIQVNRGKREFAIVTMHCVCDSASKGKGDGGEFFTQI